METGPQLLVSSESLVEPEIKGCNENSKVYSSLVIYCVVYIIHDFILLKASLSGEN